MDGDYWRRKELKRLILSFVPAPQGKYSLPIFFVSPKAGFFFRLLILVIRLTGDQLHVYAEHYARTDGAHICATGYHPAAMRPYLFFLFLRGFLAIKQTRSVNAPRLFRFWFFLLGILLFMLFSPTESSPPCLPITIWSVVPYVTAWSLFRISTGDFEVPQCRLQPYKLSRFW